MPTYYIDAAVGNDSNAGTSPGSGNAWATIQKFVDTASAGDTGYVKASGNYNELVTITGKTGTESNPFILEGYTSSPGDGGRAIIDAQNTRNNCILFATTASVYWEFRNFQLQGSPSTQRLCNRTIANCNQIKWLNCRFTNGSGSPQNGLSSSNSAGTLYWLVEGCEFDNISGYAIDNLNSSTIIYNTFRSINSSNGLVLLTGNALINRNIFANCSGTIGITLNSGSSRMVANNNTFYNMTGTSMSVLAATGTSSFQFIATNNIFVNVSGSSATCVRGASGTNSGAHYVGNNAFYNVTAQYSNATSFGSDVTLTGNPYTDATNYDFSLNATTGAGAACKGVSTGANFPLSVGTGTSSTLDLGAIQSAASGGGGSGLAKIFGC